MKFANFGATVLLMFAAGPAATETIRVNPEFHTLNRHAKGPARRLESSYKSSAVEPPVRFESRAHIDQDGQIHLHCKQPGDHQHSGDKDE